VWLAGPSSSSKVANIWARPLGYHFVVDKKALVGAYRNRVVLCEELGPVMENLVRQLLAAADVRVHSVDHRVKQPASFTRKISQPGVEYVSIEDIHDVLGLRVITYFPDEVDLVAAVIEEHFNIDDINSVDKRVALDPDRFGYLSLHYVCSLNDARAALVEHARFAGLKCEIQIRSILQHAWAEIEHDLGYTTSIAIPTSIRRRFYRLAGVLEIADSEFQSLRDQVEQYQKQARRQVARKPDVTPIDRDTLVAYVGASPSVEEVAQFMAMAVKHGPEEIDGAYADMLVGAFTDLGLTTVGEIDSELTTNVELVKQMFIEWIDKANFGDLSRGAVLFYLAYVVVCNRENRDKVIAYAEARNFRAESSELAERLLVAHDRARKTLTHNGGVATV
jgi:putative GTP pyrophosphokinase